MGYICGTVMSATEIPANEVKRILLELASQGQASPEPSQVLITPTDDFEGDPIVRLSVVFPEGVAPEATRWGIVSPLVMRLTRWVMENRGFERPVQTEVVRLSDKVPVGV
jgi:hypothetical protein